MSLRNQENFPDNLSSDSKAGPWGRLKPLISSHLGIGLLGLLTGITAWWLGSEVSRSKFLPGPATVWYEAAKLYHSGVLTSDILASLSIAAVGYFGGVALAVPAGLALGWYAPLRAFFEPWIQFFRSIPSLALIPLMIIILGIGATPKYVIIGLASFLATLIATYQGVLDLDPSFVNAARVLGASERSIFIRVVIPAASPYILVGARIAIGNAWGTLVAAELISSRSGLGYMTQEGALYFNVPEMFVSIILIGILGFLMDRGVFLFQQRVTSWKERKN